ncbi:M20/M25/M40 family metallo-hydrolase [Candidatus Peregrinibacteria bacterium]|nr:M20/M25/M40 family metallo-hydrolase [Candidatus Peregrinibacteria bacterium]
MKISESFDGEDPLAMLKQIQQERVLEKCERDELAYIDDEVVKRYYEEMKLSDGDMIDKMRVELGLKGYLHALAEIPEAEMGKVALIKGVTRLEIEDHLNLPDVFCNSPDYSEMPDSEIKWDEKLTNWVIDKTMNLIRFGAVSAGCQTSFEAIRASFDYFCVVLHDLGLPYRAHLDGPYPYVEILPKGESDTMFLAHLDVAEAQDKDQFVPRVITDRFGQKWTKGRASADMIGSTMVGVKALGESHKRFENVPGMLVVFNEEQAEQDYEGRKTGTNAFLEYARNKSIDLSDKTFVALERTNNPDGEGVYAEKELVGEIADKSRGAMSIHITVKGVAGHGGAVRSANLTKELPKLQNYIIEELCKKFPLTTAPGFNNQIIPIFIKTGQPDSTTLPGEGHLELMIRIVPGADFEELKRLMEETIEEYGLDIEYNWKCIEPGPVARRENRVLKRMADSIAECHGKDAVKFQNKPHASSARIAVKHLGCEAFVWGPTAGLFPHGRNEKMHVSSIPAGGKVLIKFLQKANTELE